MRRVVDHPLSSSAVVSPLSARSIAKSPAGAILVWDVVAQCASFALSQGQ